MTVMASALQAAEPAALLPHWLDLGPSGLNHVVQHLQQPVYRARQLFEAYCKHPLAAQPQALAWPAAFKHDFFERYRWQWFNKAQGLIDPVDATRKWLVELADGKQIQMVMIPDQHRRTLCISSQVGCAMACSFCSTGDMGFIRNLTAGEIVGQWLLVDAILKQDENRGLSQTVFMGMGEPLHNEKNLRLALDWLTLPDALGVSPTRVTVSTVGIEQPLARLIEQTNVNIAVSLHAAETEVRKQIVPAERGFTAQEVRHMLLQYKKLFRQRKLTFEVVVLPNVNASDRAAKALVEFARGLPARVNLIPFNPYPGSRYQRPEHELLLAMQKIIKAAGIACFIRRTRGQNILASCGTLNNEKLGYS